MERPQRRMQSEKAIEVEHGFMRNINVRAHCVVLLLAVWDNNIQAICGPSLENYHQAFVMGVRTPCAQGSASQEAGHSRRAHDGKNTIAKEYPACNSHKVSGTDVAWYAASAPSKKDAASYVSTLSSYLL